MLRNFAAGLALALAAAGTSHANTLFADDFDAYGTPGTSDLNFNGFGGNWTVTGQVDLVQSGEFGITCPGKCVDLDGTSGPGQLLSQPIAFSAGKQVVISFEVSGNQRGGADDEFNFEALFGSELTYNVDFIGGFQYGLLGPFTNSSTGTYVETIASGRPFLTYTFSFTPTSAGTLQLRYATPSADNIGPILDNVAVSQVPEPATWAMMILGFGMVGFAARRARVAAPRHA